MQTPGGGGYIAQRMMSAKNEKHSLFATLWFTVAHYCLRPWPWILVALSALVLLPRLQTNQIKNQNIVTQYDKAFYIYKNLKEEHKKIETLSLSPQLLNKVKAFQNKDFYERFENTVDPGKMYPKLMVEYLPPGLLGLMIAVFLAAYMSTIASQLNWGSSYIINDFYRRFIKKKSKEKHYVLISRLSIIILMIISLLITKYLLTTISGAWEFIINTSAGIGAVLILRWYWWRINAWSEIAAMIAPLIIYPIAHFSYGLKFPITLYPTVIGTTIVWLMVTYITKPSKHETLKKFYIRIHPGGPGWRKFRKEFPEIQADSGYGKLFVNWFFGVVFVYSILYSSGKLIFENYLEGTIALVIGIISAVIIYLNIKKKENLLTDD